MVARLATALHTIFAPIRVRYVVDHVLGHFSRTRPIWHWKCLGCMHVPRVLVKLLMLLLVPLVLRLLLDSLALGQFCHLVVLVKLLEFWRNWCYEPVVQ